MTGATDRTTVDHARAQLLEHVTPVQATESVAVHAADGRTLAGSIDAPRAVPHYDRAAMDGYAVRAGDVVDANQRAPVSLTPGDRVGPGQTVKVDTGELLPARADSVVVVEQTERVGDEVIVFDAVAPGENVGAVGEDVEEGERLFTDEHRLGPADLGLLREVGIEKIDVYRQPTVALIPTGEELVAADPGPGEMIETNSLTIGSYVQRWGGTTERTNPVTDDSEAIRRAVADVLDADLILTLGGTSAGERDKVPDVIASSGSVFVHGVALKPGHPVGLGIFEETPVIMLPGYPVGCLVAAMALVRPAVFHLSHRSTTEPPTTDATLSRKLASSVGNRTYARVALDDGVATPIRARGSSVLSSVTKADGWVVVPESTEGFQKGASVAIEHWEGWP